MLDRETVHGTQITYEEYLLVRTWRRIIGSGGDCPLAGLAFAALPDGEEALFFLAAFLRVLGHGSRHMLTVGHHNCVGLTADERQILALLAAAQRDDDALLASHLCWLVRGESQERVRSAVRQLGRMLADQGLVLPPPIPAALPGPAMLSVVQGGARAVLH